MLKFLQFSDVHLDSRLQFSAIDLLEAERRQRESEIKRVVFKACGLAKEEEVNVILIPGDLFDYESGTLDTVNFLIDKFADLEHIPVIISPGNHDPYSPSSHYNSELLEQRGQKRWPNNVHIFQSTDFETYILPNRKDVAVTGICYTQNHPIEDRLLAIPIHRPDAATNILIFHGSREGYAPPKKEITLPFSDEELISQPFDYAAIGHYHSYSKIVDEEGNVRAAYSGCPAGRGLDETGEKFVLLGQIDETGKVSIEKKVVDERVVHNFLVNVTGLSHTEAVLSKIKKAVEKEAKNQDIVYVKILGLFPPGIELNIPEGFLAEKYFHIKIDTIGIRPDYEINKYLKVKEETTEAKFVRHLWELKEKAANDDEKAKIEKAIYYGLDALIQKEVTPRYED